VNVRILLINGPNLNALGRRDTSLYGSKTLPEIESAVIAGGKELDAEVSCFQSNSEGAIVDYIQEQTPNAQGIIINGGALSHYGLSLRDALVDTGLPVVEVHLSNIHARESWRQRSVTGSVAKGVIAGLGWSGYLYALDYLVTEITQGGEQ
jgi:3-dehydroquinate dehydratase-2